MNKSDTAKKLNSISDRAACLASLAIAASTIRDGLTLNEQDRLNVSGELLNAIASLADALAQDTSALAGTV